MRSSACARARTWSRWTHHRSPRRRPNARSQAGQAIDSNPNPAAVTLTDDFTTDLTIDFGFNTPCAGKIGDFVWFDVNRNGIQDVGEAGIDGVTVRLIDDATSTVLASDITGPGGYYVFKGRCGGTYRVEVDATTLPPGYVPAPSLVGGDSAKDSNGSPFTLTLPNDFATDYTIDFGYMAACEAKIGDFVWKDANANGIQDGGEPGIGRAGHTAQRARNVPGRDNATERERPVSVPGPDARLLQGAVRATPPPDCCRPAERRAAIRPPTATPSPASSGNYAQPGDSDLTVDAGFYYAGRPRRLRVEGPERQRHSGCGRARHRGCRSSRC